MPVQLCGDVVLNSAARNCGSSIALSCDNLVARGICAIPAVRSGVGEGR